MKKIIDVSKFQQRRYGLLDGIEIFIVVKSQNQIERRRRMIEPKKKNRYGRFKPFPTSTGLLVKGKFKNDNIDVKWKKELREPRHIKRMSNSKLIITEINRLLVIDSNGDIVRSYEDPFFGYLHTIDLSKDEQRALVVSSGYDALFEIDLKTGKKVFEWFAWEHGFNPAEDGTWYAVDKSIFEQYTKKGKRAVYIDPKNYGEQGVTTANRVAHPNAAIYDFRTEKERPSAILILGHNGLLTRIDLTDGTLEKLYDRLCVMAHGIFPTKENGFMITQTTIGEWLWLDKNHEEEIIFDFKRMAGKAPGTENSEWIQQVVPLDGSKALAIDANRGLIAFDYENEVYSIYSTDENWCVQDLLILQ